MSDLESKCWEVIEDARWGDRADYKQIGVELGLKHSGELLRLTEYFAELKVEELRYIIEKHHFEKDVEWRSDFGLGDDRFWDLRCHIVGLGKSVYRDVLDDPEIAREMAECGDFIESFLYVFQYTQGWNLHAN